MIGSNTTNETNQDELSTVAISARITRLLGIYLWPLFIVIKLIDPHILFWTSRVSQVCLNLNPFLHRMIGFIVYCDLYNINTLYTFTIFMTHTNRSVDSNEKMCQLSTERVTYLCKMLGCCCNEVVESPIAVGAEYFFK